MSRKGVTVEGRGRTLMETAASVLDFEESSEVALAQTGD